MAKIGVVQTIDPDGGTNTTVYSALGKQQATIDKLGRTTSFLFDDQGRVIQTVYPDLTSEFSGYDATGNRTNSVDRAGRVTRYFYDALNRITNTVYADNSSSQTVYDDLGRVARSIDAAGNGHRVLLRLRGSAPGCDQRRGPNGNSELHQLWFPTPTATRISPTNALGFCDHERV